MRTFAPSALLAALLAGAMCLLSGCGAASSSDGSSAAPPAHAAATNSLSAGTIRLADALAPRQELSRSLEDTPRSLDPSLAEDVPAMEVLIDLFEGLVYPDRDGSPRPGVATSWEHSPDGLTWTFHLRTTARWSNGAPVTAEDFIGAWRREIDPKTGAQYADAFATFVNADAITRGYRSPDTLGAEAPDAHTLRIHLVKPTPYLLGMLSQPYMYPTYAPAIRQYGDRWVQPAHMVSNGPFVLEQYILGNRVTLRKNPYYWDAADVRLSRVVYYVLADPDQVALRFMAGDVQLTDIFDQTQYPYLKSRLGDQVVVSPEFATYMLAMNFKLPPFRANRALRLALTLAVDREALMRYLHYGVNEPAYTLMPDIPGYRQPVPSWARLDKAQRNALARRLYHEAGYSPRHPLRIDIEIPTQGPSVRHFFEAIAANWNVVLGADIGVHEEEFKVHLQDRELQKLPLYFDGWDGDYLDPFTYLQCFASTNPLNSNAYDNPRFDALLDQAEHENDAARRYQLLAQAQRLLDDDVAYLPLYYYADRHLIKPYVRGWQSNLLDFMPSRYLYILQHQGR